MHVTVDPERCQGHTLCAMIAPDMFELDEVDGHSTTAASSPGISSTGIQADDHRRAGPDARLPADPAGAVHYETIAAMQRACDEQRLAEPVTVRKAAAGIPL